jgi:hypothetical protein
MGLGPPTITICYGKPGHELLAIDLYRVKKHGAYWRQPIWSRTGR